MAGCRVGLIDGDDVWIWDIVDEPGEPVQLKLEGIEPLGADGGVPLRFGVVANMDQPDLPALIGTLDLTPSLAAHRLAYCPGFFREAPLGIPWQNTDWRARTLRAPRIGPFGRECATDSIIRRRWPEARGR